MRASALPSTRFGRVRRFALLVLQALALALTLQISGAAHSAQDVVLSVFEPAVCHESDCADDSGRCPPGCPKCHCAPVPNMVPPSGCDAGALLDPPFVRDACDRPATDELHASGWHASIYRPPRWV